MIRTLNQKILAENAGETIQTPIGEVHLCKPHNHYTYNGEGIFYTDQIPLFSASCVSDDVGLHLDDVWRELRYYSSRRELRPFSTVLTTRNTLAEIDPEIITDLNLVTNNNARYVPILEKLIKNYREKFLVVQYTSGTSFFFDNRIFPHGVLANSFLKKNNL